ncbi:MAG: hypothetical protein AAGJ83_04460, partial [Planctomycetota bacterium]
MIARLTKREQRGRRAVALMSTVLPCFAAASISSQTASGGDGVRRLPRVDTVAEYAVDRGGSSGSLSQAAGLPMRQLPAEWNQAKPEETAPPRALRPIEQAVRRMSVVSGATPDATQIPDRWLPSVTNESCKRRAVQHLDDAFREYTYRAFSSAEGSAWKTLEWLGTGVDVAHQPTLGQARATSMVADIEMARVAIGEAQDFVMQGVAVMDRDRLTAIVNSHRTPIFDQGLSPGVTPTEAVDRYLDFARRKLTPLAGHDVEAAQAMDLIAAIRLGRNEAKWLPEEVSLCMRRAALAGQPSNLELAERLGAQLADMGLVREAERTLRRHGNARPDQPIANEIAGRTARGPIQQVNAPRPAVPMRQASMQSSRQRVPDVIQLSPQQFATISPREYVARRHEYAGATRAAANPAASEVGTRP